jgi:hypothetical protein
MTWQRWRSCCYTAAELQVTVKIIIISTLFENRSLTFVVETTTRERERKVSTTNNFQKWEAPNTNKVAGTSHGYGFSTGRNYHTRTHTCEKTRPKPAGIPLPLLFTNCICVCSYCSHS